MRSMIKYVSIFFAIVLVGFGVAWLFTTLLFDFKSGQDSDISRHKAGLARTIQLNQLLTESAYPNLNEIIKTNKGNAQKMQENISIAYRGLPLMEVMPAHGATVENSTDGIVAGILIVDASSTPDMNTLVTLMGQKHDKFGNPCKISRMVEGGRTLEIALPQDAYTILFASGGAWFGPQNLFGPLTDKLAFDGTFLLNEKHPAYHLTTFPKEDTDFQIGAVKLKVIPKHDRMIKEKIEMLRASAETE